MTPPPCLRVLPLILLGAGLAACSPDAPVTPPPASAPPASAPPASAPPASTAPTTPSAIAPADGTNLRACGDGTCEVEVSSGDEVPLPKGSGLGPAEVTAVDAAAVGMLLPLTGTDFDSDGGCSPFITGPGAGTSGFVTMSCAAGDKATVNKVTFEVLAITGDAAVLRVRPA